ncbi:hypothetical protein [Thermococcus paralvinellae]|uniref:Uncharacterized protein n=1 Tax=Thermococcus paralvinellae TaxID=582419 RepID=W0I6G2_9EURY|nr:hypothetical protein [Thermococcus paralvinellae]AHF80025.1 Hypothetical protein TES1_0637 [Thermococcus paralvinellae]
MKKDPTPLIDVIYEELAERGIPIPNSEKFYEDMEKAFNVASKIVDKIVIMDKDSQTIETAAEIMAGHVEDPVSKLKEVGIDITPELEELKQVFAEISGKKIEPKKPSKAPNIQPELLAIAKALQFSDFSESAMRKAEDELIKLIDELTDDEANALQVFYAVKLLRLVQKRDREGIVEFSKNM